MHQVADAETSSSDDEAPQVILGVPSSRNHATAALTRNHFPSKLGGHPAWLDPPSAPELPADYRLLAQLYAPLPHNARDYHRAIYLVAGPAAAGTREPP